jgi:hypothetical protein
MNIFRSAFDYITSTLFPKKEELIPSYSIQEDEVIHPRIKIRMGNVNIKFPKETKSKKRKTEMIMFFTFIGDLYKNEPNTIRGQLIRGKLVLTDRSDKFVGEYSLSKFLKGEYNEII